MRDQLYYAIVERSGHLELHVSREKKDVTKRCALSKRIPLDSPYRPEAEKRWKSEARRFRMKKA